MTLEPLAILTEQLRSTLKEIQKLATFKPVAGWAIPLTIYQPTQSPRDVYIPAKRREWLRDIDRDVLNSAYIYLASLAKVWKIGYLSYRSSNHSVCLLCINDIVLRYTTDTRLKLHSSTKSYSLLLHASIFHPLVNDAQALGVTDIPLRLLLVDGESDIPDLSNISRLVHHLLAEHRAAQIASYRASEDYPIIYAECAPASPSQAGVYPVEGETTVYLADGNVPVTINDFLARLRYGRRSILFDKQVTGWPAHFWYVSSHFPLLPFYHRHIIRLEWNGAMTDKDIDRISIPFVRDGLFYHRQLIGEATTPNLSEIRKMLAKAGEGLPSRFTVAVSSISPPPP